MPLKNYFGFQIFQVELKKIVISDRGDERAMLSDFGGA